MILDEVLRLFVKVSGMSKNRIKEEEQKKAKNQRDKEEKNHTDSKFGAMILDEVLRHKKSLR